MTRRSDRYRKITLLCLMRGSGVGPFALAVVRAEHVQRRFVEAMQRRRTGKNPFQGGLHVRDDHLYFLGSLSVRGGG